jgi:hypothetical protein
LLLVQDLVVPVPLDFGKLVVAVVLEALSIRLM